MDITTRTLQDLDLSENEAILYGQMLSFPKSSVQQLATRAPFPRTMLYYVLNQLMQRGLVSSQKGKARTVYIAEDPERLYDLLSNKEREFAQKASEIKDLVPKLKQQYRLSGERPTVRIFEGIQEYQKALEDIFVTKPKEICTYEILREKPALEMRESFERRRISRKMKNRVLFFEDAESLKRIKKRTYDDSTQFRSIAGVASFQTDVMLYDGKLLYTSYSGEEASAILIEDRALYEMQKNLFDALWKQGKDRTLAYIEKP